MLGLAVAEAHNALLTVEVQQPLLQHSSQPLVERNDASIVAVDVEDIVTKNNCSMLAHDHFHWPNKVWNKSLLKLEFVDQVHL